MNVSAASFNPAIAYSRLSTAAAEQNVEASNEPLDTVGPSRGESTEKPSMLSYIAKGAMYGAAAGVLIPGIVVPLLGFAAAPITGPLGLVMGAFAGASAYTHPDYAPN